MLRDGTPYEIRQVQVSDYEGGRYERIHEWLGEVDEFLFIEFDPGDLERNRKSWIEQVRDQGDTSHIIIAAFLNGEIIGQANLGLSREGHHRARNTGGWGVSVKKAYHNQGVGYQLLLEIERVARRLGLHKLEASVVERNEPAKALYLRKLGYQVEGRLREHFILDGGEYADELNIGKILD
ncbi:MAG: GNAT family N-acetyltransferase [Candidatus Lokiarchaeota archaeon]|nr:GNAT family N-acetyltransferase [Candidatus Lokiarchaeota archaeon]